MSVDMVWLVVAALYGAMSLASAVATAIDKRRARRGAWRIPERTLHTIDLLGGFPGGCLARHLLRHKTAKRRFLWTSRAIVMLHVLAWIAVAVLWSERLRP